MSVLRQWPLWFLSGLFFMGCPKSQLIPIDTSDKDETQPADPGDLFLGVDSGTVVLPEILDAGSSVTLLDSGVGVRIDAGNEGPAYRLKFIALGDVGVSDVGQPSSGQYAVAEVMGTFCETQGGCDFAVMLGDNIYMEGVESATDPRWAAVFEDPYATLDFPFYATLGNHDYGAAVFGFGEGGAGMEPCVGEAQVAYGAIQNKFVMPDTFYRFFKENVEFVSLNTTAMFWADVSLIEESLSCSLFEGWSFADENERQRNDLTTWYAERSADWRIAFGHHPYLSNGRHGNAGGYEIGFEWSLPGSGEELRDFFESYIKSKFDVYLAGHDHSVQDMGEVGGTQWIVSGAGAKASEVEDRNPSAQFYVADKGFVYFEVTPDEMKMSFVIVTVNPNGPATGEIRHTRTVTR
jgi:tartrate-resistant acid phosphatase type 5